jgi:hypothetical protein
LGSYGITGVFLDEAQEIDYMAINVLKWRFSLLKGNWWKTIPKALYTCNPSKNWIYTEFYKPFKEWNISDWKVFIPSLVTDNPYIEPEYIENLKRSDKVTVERLLNGNFDYDDTPGKLYNYDKLTDLFTNPITNWNKYITCDVAREWRDKTVILVWNWYEIVDYKIYKKNTLVELQDAIKTFCQKYQIWMSDVVVDEDWVGWWVVDNLYCKGFVNNSKQIQNREWCLNYQNLKTQCYFELARLIQNNLICLRMLVSCKQEVIEELDAICEIDIDKDWPKKIIKKEDLKQNIWRSPDFADAIMMRCYFDLKPKQILYIETF